MNSRGLFRMCRASTRIETTIPWTDRNSATLLDDDVAWLTPRSAERPVCSA